MQIERITDMLTQTEFQGYLISLGKKYHHLNSLEIPPSVTYYWAMNFCEEHKIAMPYPGLFVPSEKIPERPWPITRSDLESWLIDKGYRKEMSLAEYSWISPSGRRMIIPSMDQYGYYDVLDICMFLGINLPPSMALNPNPPAP